jgi:hypothetical protein
MQSADGLAASVTPREEESSDHMMELGCNEANYCKLGRGLNVASTVCHAIRL